VPRDRGVAARICDDAALLCAGVLLASLVISGWRHEANGLPGVLLVVAAGAVYTLGRRLRALPVALTVLWAIAVAAAGLVVVWPDVLSGRALADPTGYGNANGSLLACGVLAALAAAVLQRSPVWRIAGLLLAAALLAATFATRSQAASFMAVASAAALGTLVVSHSPALRAAALSAVGGLTSAVLLLTLGLGLPVKAVLDLPGMKTVAEELAVRRVLLWQDALNLTADHPGTGVGPGKFPEASYVARSDADTRHAHSLPFEEAAETGVAGGVAVVGLLAALFAAAVVRVRGPLVALAVGSVCVFAGQSFIDYTYRYPAVILGWALLAGVLAGVRPNGVRQ
jgi:O-antigen ligase